MKKKIISLLLVTALLLTLVPAAFAADTLAYVAMGDSIAAGYGLDGYTGAGSTPKIGFPYLVSQGIGANLTDLSVSGMDTGDLLGNLNGTAYQEALKNADVITLTIGSNDLLKPGVAFLLEQLGIDASEYTDSEKLKDKIVEVLSKSPLTYVQKVSTALKSDAGKKLIADSLATFCADWDTIIARIKEINSDAKLIVTGFYNPYADLSLASYGITAGDTIQDAIDAMNEHIISANTNNDLYTIVDISDITTNVSLSLLNVADSDVDPHPDAKGHAAIASRVLANLTEYIPEQTTLPFTDVSATASYYNAILKVYNAGLMNGVSTTEFGLNSNLTRETIVTVLFRLDGQPFVSGAPAFTDVTAGQWYTDAVIWATTKGITNGMGDNQFGVGVNITNEQLIAMVYRYLSDKGNDMTLKNNESKTQAEASGCDAWAVDAVAWAIDSNVITADGFAPAVTATRLQIALAMSNLLTVLGK